MSLLKYQNIWKMLVLLGPGWVRDKIMFAQTKFVKLSKIGFLWDVLQLIFRSLVKVVKNSQNLGF